MSVIAVETGDPPRWYGYAGFVVAVGLVANLLLGLGGLAGLALLWVLGLAVVLLVRRAQPEP